jgi:hypothetical protein
MGHGLCPGKYLYEETFMKRPTFRNMLGILRDLVSEIARYFLVAAIGVVGQATIIENPDTVSGTGTVAVQGNAAIIESPDTLSATGKVAIQGHAAIIEAPEAPSARATSN